MMRKAFDGLMRTAGFKKRPPDDGGPRYADINERALAAAIDVMLLYFLLFPLFMWIQAHIFGYVNLGALREAQEAARASTTNAELEKAGRLFLASGQPQMWLLNAFIQVFVIGLLIVSGQCAYGTTPGKYLLGLRIVDAKTLETPKPWQFIVRFIAYIPSALPAMIGVFWISFNSSHRGWHDYIARTAVLNMRPYGWYWKQVKQGFRWLRNKLKNNPA